MRLPWWVTCVAFSRDGMRIVSSSEDGTLIVWDAKTCLPLLSLKGHVSWVTAVAWSSDDTCLVSAGEDGTIRVWKARVSQSTRTLNGERAGFSALVFNPDGWRLAAADVGGHLWVWDVRKGEQCLQLRGHSGGICCLAYSPNGKRLISGGFDKMVKVWDAENGKGLLVLRGHEGVVDAVAYSTDAKRIASTSRDMVLKLWDAQNGGLLFSGPVPGAGITKLAFDPRGTRLRCQGPTGARIDFDTITHKWVKPDKATLAADTRRVVQPGGRLVATVEGLRVRVTDLAPAPSSKPTRYRRAYSAWHAEQSDRWEATRDWFPAAFHLERLRRLYPLDSGARRRLDAALRQCPDHAGASAVRRRAEAFEAAQQAARLLPLVPGLPRVKP